MHTAQTLLFFLLSATAFAFPPSFPGYGGPGFGGDKTVYLQTNEAENSLVAIPINPQDGTLSGGVKVSTGGAGSNEATPNGPHVPDALGSQGSVTVSGSLIFLVNAGSNTLSVFAGGSAPRLLGAPIALPGEFPVSVAVSERNQLACVGFTGAKAGISCVPFSRHGPGKASALYPFDLAQSTPPSTTGTLLGQVFFSEDEQHVYATVRGAEGFFASVPVSEFLGRPAAAAAAFSVKGASVALFDGISLPGNTVIAADPTVGARILSVDPATQLATVTHTVNVTGQIATCWIAWSEKTGYGYIDDAGQNKVTAFDVSTGAIVQQATYGGSAAGGFDLAIGGGYIYILFAGNGSVGGSITVLSINDLKEVQVFDLSHLGISDNAVGIAV